MDDVEASACSALHTNQTCNHAMHIKMEVPLDMYDFLSL